MSRLLDTDNWHRLIYIVLYLMKYFYVILIEIIRYFIDMEWALCAVFIIRNDEGFVTLTHWN